MLRITDGEPVVGTVAAKLIFCQRAPEPCGRARISEFFMIFS
jgi:hypothetical protein